MCCLSFFAPTQGACLAEAGVNKTKEHPSWPVHKHRAQDIEQTPEVGQTCQAGGACAHRRHEGLSPEKAQGTGVHWWAG